MMGSLSDPDGGQPLVAAVQWFQGTMLGTVATVIAVIAVAGVGALMLTGRLEWRRGATVVFGCFVLFGSASIASGIMSGLRGGEVVDLKALPPPVAAPVVRPPVNVPPAPFDPYAGASTARPPQPIR